MLHMQGDSPHLLHLFIDPPEAKRSMLPLITRRPILTRAALASQAEASAATGGRLTCFSSLVAGSGSLHTSMQRTRALPFRSVDGTPLVLTQPTRGEMSSSHIAFQVHHEGCVMQL